MDIFNSWLVESPIAHRGLHDKNCPENTLAAFENAAQNGFAIELDVQAISDGTVVVFHDECLSRLIDNDGYVKFLRKADLDNLKIRGSEEKIPTLEEALACIDGRVPVLIEIKNGGKIGALEKSVIKILENYKGEYAIQSFNPFVLEYFYKHAPHILRGQLSGNIKDKKMSFVRRYVLRHMSLNKKVSHPDFINYEADALPNRYVKKYKHLPLLAWTVRSQSEYLRVVKYCDNIVFENFEPKI